MASPEWAMNRGLRLEYLDNHESQDTGLVPMLFVPGLLGAASNYDTELAALAPRRAVAVSLRGRGRSDTPATGYSLQDHASDIAAVVAQADLQSFCLMAYSQSVPYALTYALQAPEQLRGLIIGDYPARAPALPLAWVEQLRSAVADDAMQLLTALQRESREVVLWDELPRVVCPVLVLRGGQPDARLSAENAARYRQGMQHADVVTFADAGHELWHPDADRYLATIRAFLERLDGATVA